MRYKQLTQEQRYRIDALKKAGHNQSGIAMMSGRSRSTISRELQRDTGLRGYRPEQAQRLSDKRRQAKVRYRLTETTRSHVRHLLELDWSAEQISLWLKAHRNRSVRHEWSYQYIVRDKHEGGICIVICAAKSSAVNAMAATIAGVSLSVVSALTSAPESLIPVHVSATGNSIP